MNRNNTCNRSRPACPFPLAPGMDDRGFTLLAVVIAIAVLAIAFTSLFSSQSQSLSLAIETKFNVTASFLAQEKLAEYEAGLNDLSSGEGDFGEDFPGFTWKVEVAEANLDGRDELRELQRAIQRLELTINWEGEQFSTTLTYYGREGTR